MRTLALATAATAFVAAIALMGPAAIAAQGSAPGSKGCYPKPCPSSEAKQRLKKKDAGTTKGRAIREVSGLKMEHDVIERPRRKPGKIKVGN
jgi:hypothetical protein